MVVGGVSPFEPAIEVLSSVNCYNNNSVVFSCGFSILRKPFITVVPRRKKQWSRHTTITTSALSDGGVVLDKEFEFKPSFDEYLKAMESAKIDRGSTSNNDDSDTDSNLSIKSPRKKRVIKKIVQDNDEGTSVQEYSRKSGFHKKDAIFREDYKMVGSKEEVVLGNVKKKKIIAGKKRDSNESEFMYLERAAFKTMENEDVVDKPRVTKVDMEERIQKLAKCLNGADVDMPAWKFSEMMRSAEVRFSDHSILRIVQILGKLGNWKRVLQVIEWIQSRERFKSHKIRHIYTAALDALGKARRPVESLNLFRGMLEQMATYPDIVAYRCIAVTLGQAGHMKELFDVMDIMKSPPKKKFKNEFNEKWDPRLEPDIIVYNAVLNACVRRKKWEGAFWVLQQLSQQGQQPSSTTYGLVMEVMLACGKYNLVHDFFRKVQKSYIPNALIYKVLVNTLWREGKIDEAIIAVEDMERRGIVGNASLYYDLARCLCSAGRCNEALKQIEKICKVANKPLVVTYTGLIQACLDSDDVESGSFIFNHMQKFCSPNLITYNIMLKAFVDHGKFEEAKQLFQRLLENSNFISREEDYKGRVIPDIYSFNTMLDACAVEQKWDDLEFVYAQMLRYGHHFNTKRHLRLLLDARRAGKVEILEMTWKQLVEAERVPPPPLITEMFCMRLEQGKYAAALSCLTNHASVESHLSSRKSWSKFFLENAHRFDEGTLDKLMHEASILLAATDNLPLQHLIESGNEILRSQRTVEVDGSRKAAAFAL